MTDRELIRRALQDAMSWQHAVAEASGMDTGAGKAAALLAAKYRDMLTRKYGVGLDVGRARGELQAILRGPR
jgi:hypothetical protein